MCLHTWILFNELEPDTNTHFSDPLQHMGELVSPVWSNYIQNSLTCCYTPRCIVTVCHSIYHDRVRFSDCGRSGFPKSPYIARRQCRSTKQSSGFPQKRYELHLSVSRQGATNYTYRLPAKTLRQHYGLYQSAPCRYGISIRTVILKEETDHRFMEDRASLATTSTLAIRDYGWGHLETTYKNPPRHPRLNSTTNKEIKRES